MDQNDVGGYPYISPPSPHHLQPHLLPPSTSFSTPIFDTFTPPFLDHQDLAFSLSRLNISSYSPSYRREVAPPPSFEFPGDHIMRQERFLNNNINNNNVAFMRAQNGGLSPGVGFLGGPERDFLVGPGPVMNNYGERLNFDMLAQMGYGSSSCFTDYDIFLKRNQGEFYPHFPSLSQNDCLELSHYNVVKQPKVNSFKEMVLKKKNEMFNLVDFRGKLVALATDHNWSKVLQVKIEELSFEENEVVLSEVLDSVAELLKNQFGSYFMQKVFLHCNEEQRTRFIVAVTRVPYQLVSICLCSHGAKSMQIVLENLSTPEQISLVMSALSPGTVLLANDTYGHHVIQYCVESFPSEYNKYLLDEIAKNCLRIAIDKSGCCVLQTCVEHSRGECRERIIKEIIANLFHIVEDPFGNYVVQHLLGLRVPKITDALTRRLRGCFSSLSCNKFASNVVEKFLVEAGEEHAGTIIKELLVSPNDVAKLLVDPYGNFVIQSALSVSQEMQGPFFNMLVELIIVNAPFIRSNLYAKKVFDWLKRQRLFSA